MTFMPAEKFAGFRSAYILVVLTLIGCSPLPSGWVDSSRSVSESKSRGLYLAKYDLPEDIDLAGYRLVEVWVENAPQGKAPWIVVRLDGPHHGEEPRVQVVGRARTDYRGIWSERDGPPYEMWNAPDPLPEKLTLERDGKRVEVTKRTD